MRMILTVVTTAAVLLGASMPSMAQTQRLAPATRSEVMASFAPVVKRATPAVVNVYASRVETRPINPLFDDPIFRQFFGNNAPSNNRVSQSLGSGVIVDSSGLVVTNHHVIEGMTSVKVALSDHREFDAEIVLRDQRTDLAVLRLKGGTNFPVMELGDSDALEVGDLALAIGNPFGVGQTVTQGIVSALARTQVGISDFGFFIQTDAAINPGNSGGALIDMNSRLVGINSAIYSKSGGSIGIGFAIPVNMVKVVIATAKSGGTQVHRPWIGANFQIVSREIAESLSMDRPTGALVSDVKAGGPAADAGLKRGDVVLTIDGQAVDDPESLGYRMATKPLNSSVALGVARGGKNVSLPMKLVAAPEIPAREAAKLTGRHPLAGATVWNGSPAVADELSVEADTAGVVVAEVEDGSAAADVGLQKGDIIVSINDAAIATTSELRTALAKRQSYWKISVGRGGQVLTTIVGG